MTEYGNFNLTNIFCFTKDEMICMHSGGVKPTINSSACTSIISFTKTINIPNYMKNPKIVLQKLKDELFSQVVLNPQHKITWATYKKVLVYSLWKKCMLFRDAKFIKER